MEKGIKQKYIGSAVFMLAAAVLVKLIGAVYKIPLTSYIGATGRGYFSVAYNLYLPVHALTMGAFPIALTKLVSTYNAKNNRARIIQLRRASKKLFFIAGLIGAVAVAALAVPYSNLICSSPKSIYTVFAIAPSVFFSCLCACHRAFSEGFIDMKPTAVSQLIEALVKMIFGLLFARLAMSCLYNCYLQTNTVMGALMKNEEQAFSAIYPFTSAAAMLGTTFGSIAAYAFAKAYTQINYKSYSSRKIEYKSAYNELLAFSVPLVCATVIQSLSNFADTSSIQYCLTLCDKSVLEEIYGVQGEDLFTYVYGIFAAALDFKNLVPAVVMALGITAVPAVSAAFESDTARFTRLINEIFKYTVVLGIAGGLVLALFSKDILSLFYSKSNPDIVENAGALLFYSAVTILPCCAAVTSVYCTQALGFAKQTIIPFIVAAVIRILINFILVTKSEINILGSCVSNFLGFTIIIIATMLTIHKKTNTDFDLKSIFIKPIFAGVITYFAVDGIKKYADAFESKIFYLVILLIILVVFYSISLITLKIISIKEIKSFK